MQTTHNPSDARSGSLATANHLLGLVDTALIAIAAVGIFCLMLFGVAEIVLRLLFNRPVIGYLDILEQSLAIFAFLGAAFAQHAGAHIRMEMLIAALKGRALWAAELFGTLIAIFVLAVIIRYSWIYFMSAWELGDSTADIELPTWPSKLLVPVAFSIWLLRLVIQATGFARLLVWPDAEPLAVPTIKEAAELAREEIRDALGDAENPQAGAAPTQGPAA